MNPQGPPAPAIEAKRWDGTAAGATEVIDWLLQRGATARYVCADATRCEENGGDSPHAIAIDVSEGVVHMTLGDWAVSSAGQEIFVSKRVEWDA